MLICRLNPKISSDLTGSGLTTYKYLATDSLRIAGYRKGRSIITTPRVVVDAVLAARDTEEGSVLA